MGATASPEKEGRSFAGAPVSGAPARRRKPVDLPAAVASEALLIRIAPSDTGLFRYLLEGGDNLAMLTVLDPKKALFKLLFSPHQRGEVRAFLESMRQTVPFEVQEWPFGPFGRKSDQTPAPASPAGKDVL